MNRNATLAWGARGPEFKSRRPDQLLLSAISSFRRSGKNPPISLTGTATPLALEPLAEARVSPSSPRPLDQSPQGGMPRQMVALC